LTGFDLCEQRIALAIRMLHERYPQYANKMGFRQADADSRFPFEDASFDVVIAVAMLEHVVDVYSVMDEIARVCRAGGCAILTVPNICYVKNIFTLLRGHLPSTGGPTSDVRMWRQYGWDGYHLHYFSKPALKTLLEETGFTPEIWTGSGRWAKLRRWCTNLVGDMTVRALRRAVGKPALP
jgi:ubiquinone/menaquinone biosynthesis C-methylase UbiE